MSKGAQTTTIPAKPIRLGVMVPLTGLVEIYGREISLAAQIACAEVNANGGVLGQPLELIIADDGSLPESAVAAAEQLLEKHGCAALVGNLLSNSRIAVAYRVAEPRQIPYLNFSFYEGSISSRYFFHFAALPNQQIDKMIPWMLAHHGRKMFFAGNNYEWPRGSIDAAKRALELSGGEVVGEEYYPLGITPDDLERLLDNLIASGAEVFVPYFAGLDQVHLLTAFAARGLKKRVAVVMGHFDEAMAGLLTPEVRDGFYSSNTYFMGVETPENQRYLTRLGAMPGVTGIWPQGNGVLTNFGEGTYLCVKAFAQAANQAASIDPEALIQALETISLVSPQGQVRMDPATHHATVNTYLACCRADGSFEIIEQFGALAPKLPERYRYLRMSGQAQVDEEIRLQSRILEQMREAVFLVDARDGTIVYTNPGSERMFGYAPGELTGKPMATLNAPGDETPEARVAAIDAVLYRKGVWHGEVWTSKKDGAPFWCAGRISAFTHFRYGEVWLAAYQDISERKQAELALQESEAFINSIVENIPDMIFVKDAKELRFVKFNRAGEKLLGHRREELYGKNDFDFFPPEEAEFFTNKDREVLKAKQPLDIPEECLETRYLGKRILHTKKIPLTDAQGNPRYLLGISEDITERREAELRLLASEQAFRAVVENSPDVIVRYDREGRRIYVNPEFERVNHLSAKEVLGKTPVELSTELAPKASIFTEKLMAAMAAGNVTKIDLSWTKDGQPVCWFVRVVPEFDTAGRVVSALTIWSDISERKRMEDSLRELNEELEQRVQARTAEMEQKNRELERLNRLFVGRELRMRELKEKIKEREKQANVDGEQGAQADL